MQETLDNHSKPTSLNESQTTVHTVYPSDHSYGPAGEIINTPTKTIKIAIINAMSSALNFIPLSSFTSLESFNTGK